MGICIITDSASDLDQNELQGVHVIPMTVSIDGDTFRDGVDITKDQFYNRLETSEEMPVSSLVSPAQFEEVFEKLTEEGMEAIVITISSGLSGTYQSALIAAEDYAMVSVVDSLQVSSAEQILVRRALQLVQQGMGREEIVKTLEEEKRRIVIFAYANTLKYLHKGGRISKGSALVGGVMGVKPLLTLEEGKMICIAKNRGSKQSNRAMNAGIENYGGVDFAMPYAVGYSGREKNNLLEFMHDNPLLTGPDGQQPAVVQIGTAVGTHCGPGAVSVTFFRR